MNVGEICNRDVVIIRKNESVLNAALLMRQHHVGDVVVVEDRGDLLAPVGILTDRDIVVGILAEQLDPESVSVGDVMSFELLTAGEKDGIMETVKRMRQKGVRRIPVVNGKGGLEGILTVDDLVELMAEQINDIIGLITYEQWHERDRRE